MAADKLRSTNQHHNRRMGVTNAQCIDTTMDFMEKSGVFNTQYGKSFDAAANVLRNDGSKEVCRLKQICTPKGVLRNDGSKEVCRLKQICTPKGAVRKYLTTVTDVMILNYAVGLDMARGIQSNTLGAWPYKLPIDSLPLQVLAKSPKLMSDLSKQPRRNFPSAVAG